MHTLEDIIPPSRRKEKEAPHNRPTREQRTRFPFVTCIVAVLIIAASICALFYFSSAKVEVTPSTVSAEVQASFTASESSGLPFQIITAQKTASQSVAGSGTKTVNSFASGTITIYNTQTKTQQLIANTRFATASGLIFRIHSAVSIPGGSTAKPGSITTKVYADKAGDSYNIGPTSFTIPGFAGMPQATQVYARSTSSMTGGLSGSVPVVDSALEAKTRAALIEALGPSLVSSLEAQIPTDYMLIPGAATTTYQDLTPEPSSSSGMVDIKEQGTITAIVFPNAALAEAIATSVQNLEYNNEPLTLSSAEGLVFSAGGGFPDPNVSSFSFSLSGTASFVYTIDLARIAAAVAGETRAAAETALTNYPEVKRAVIILRPFWRQTFPQDPSAISVEVVRPH
jgi:hypothetical protein